MKREERKLLDIISEYISEEELILLLINKIDDYCNYDSVSILNDIINEIREDYL